MARTTNLRDIIGMKFGKLQVLDIAERRNGKAHYLCKCDCGNFSVVRRDALITGNTKSCGQCFRIVQEKDYYRYICPDRDSFIFDACDLKFVQTRQWHISRGYPVGEFERVPRLFSRLILQPPKGYSIDHIDGDTRNNRRSNLRIVSHAQNMHNMHMRSNNSTGYKGVSLNKATGKYEVHICVDGKDKYLGLYSTKEEAAMIYDDASRKLHGEYGCVNFPVPGETSCRVAV